MPSTPEDLPEPDQTPGHALPFPVVGIGASAGGLDGFQQLLHALPSDTGMAFVLIQHLGSSSMLTQILSRETRMPVLEANGTRTVEPDHVYVITPGTELTLAEGKLVSSRHTEPEGHHHVIDTFLNSLAEAQGYRSMAVILSGSATDGTLGLGAVKAAGGITFAQDGTAAYDSMPRSAIGAGTVDFVLPPYEIAREIARIALHPYVAPPEGAGGIAPGFNIDPMLELLLDRTGVDFSQYKRATLLRRIHRRMVLREMATVDQYLLFLKEHAGELDALYRDILINVTSFFRNADTFEKLKTDVFPRLLEARARHDPIRFWVVGCATGEEAYSVAIAFSEFLADRGKHATLQVFATDISSACIEKARIGIYPASIAQTVSSERLHRYFVEVTEGYLIQKSIRDMCIFARHNALSDPPFSRIDFISCCNLLIYLDRELQQRILGILHYALRANGVLMLGRSETVGAQREFFDLDDAKHKIYRKRPGRAMLPQAVEFRAMSSEGKMSRSIAATFRDQTSVPGDALKESERLLLSRYAPPSILLNPEFDILQFRGNTGAYLAPAPGRASLNVLKMLRDGLLLGTRAALQKAKRENKVVRKEGLRVKDNDGYRDVNIEVHPIGGSGHESTFLVLFEDPVAASAQRSVRRKVKPASGRMEDISNERLKQELEASRDYLQSVIEQQEATNEELQAANEEVQSSNEELQSVNEELETSKEEIQATNEELSTVNDELRRHNMELTQANDDLVNLFGSVQMAIVMLDMHLRIRRITPAAETMLNLIPGDIGRPLRDLNLSMVMPDFESHLREVLLTGATKQFELRLQDSRLHAVRMHPYRVAEGKINGAVLVFIDVDALRQKEVLQLRQSLLLEQVCEPLLMWEPGGKLVYWNSAAERVYGHTAVQALRHSSSQDLFDRTSPSAGALTDALSTAGWWQGEMVLAARDGRKVRVDGRMVQVTEADGRGMVIETHRLLDPMN